MKKQDKFFIKMLLLSTVLIITVVTIMAFSVYSYSAGKIKSSMADVSIKLLTQVESFADTYVFRRAEIFAAQNFMSFNEDSDIARIYSNEPLEKSFLYRYYSDLSATVTAEDFIRSVHIYIPHRNMIISSENICYLDDGNKPTLFQTEKKKLFERALAGEKWINTYQNTNGENVMTLLVKYSPYNAAVPVGVIAVDILEESIQAAFDNISKEHSGNITIIDQNGRMMSSSDKSVLYENVSDEKYVQKVLSSKENEGYFISRVEGKKQLISYKKSYYNSWSYLSTQEIGRVFGANRFLLVVTLVISLLAIIIGVFGAYLISNNYYISIRNLAELVSGTYGENGANDVFGRLSNAVYGMSDDVKKYRKLKSDIVPIAKNNLAFDLTHNRDKDREYIERQFEILGVKKDEYNAYAVCSCWFGNTDDESGAHFEYGLVEYINSLSNDERMLLCYGGGIQPVTVVICAKSKDSMKLGELVYDIGTVLDGLNYIDYIIFVGEVCHDINQVSKSYQKLSKLEKYSFIYGGSKQILEEHELFAREKSVSRLEKDTLFEALGNAMDNKNINEAVVCISQMIATLKNGCFSYDYVQEFLLKLLEYVSAYMKKSGIETNKIGVDKDALYDEYKKARTIDSIMGFIQNICVNIICMNNEIPQGYEISKKVISFVKALPDEELKNITLMYVADHLYLSQAYISRMFRNETGERFIDWLTNEKLERCAQILKNKNVKIKDVCDIMGYSNSNYFIRKFKEKYGITPKQYQFKE